MFELSLEFITGMMVGIELPPAKEIDEDLTFVLVVDLLVVRLMLVRWKKA